MKSCSLIGNFISPAGPTGQAIDFWQKTRRATSNIQGESTRIETPPLHIRLPWDIQFSGQEGTVPQMAASDFREAVIAMMMKKAGVSDASELNAVDQRSLQFALNANARGEAVCDRVDSFCSPDWSRLRVLDIGSAYGGVGAASVKRGAEYCGIEVDAGLCEIGRLNLGSAGAKAQFHLLDATGREMFERIQPGRFQLVILYNVLEHIYDTVGLLANLRDLAASGCVVYFSVPNGYSMHTILSEGHTGFPGVSIVPPDLLHLHSGPFGGVYYHKWEYYEALFRHFGFERIHRANAEDLTHLGTWADKRDEFSKRPKRELVAEDVRRVRKTLEDWQSGAEDHQFKSLALGEFRKIEKEVAFDLETLSETELVWKHTKTFWECFAVFGESEGKPSGARQDRAGKPKFSRLVKRFQDFLSSAGTRASREGREEAG
jgi:SAM-dependent methyltransferase